MKFFRFHCVLRDSELDGVQVPVLPLLQGAGEVDVDGAHVGPVDAAQTPDLPGPLSGV